VAIAAAPDRTAVDAARVTADAIEVVMGAEDDLASVSITLNEGGAAATSTAAGPIGLPQDPTAAITLGTGSMAIGLTLPASDIADELEIVDGDAVYVDQGAETSYVIDALPAGLRVASVIESPRSPHQMTYKLDLPKGTSLVPNLDGSVAVVLDGTLDSGVGVTIGGFDRPWAIDANGRTVETYYQVAGSALTQVVAPGSDVSYPLVADPSYSYCTVSGVIPAVCVKYNRTDTARFWSLIAGGIGAAAFAAEVFSFLPNFALKAACKAAVAAFYGALLINIRIAYETNRCFRVRFSFPPIFSAIGYSQVVNC